MKAWPQTGKKQNVFLLKYKSHEIKNGLQAYFGVDNILDEKNVMLFNDGRIWRGGVKYTF